MEKYSKYDIIMKRPASIFCNRWRDGTPVGNGKTGVVFYGGAGRDYMIFSRGDLWVNGNDAPVPDVSYALDIMRKLQKEGKYPEANFVMYNELKKHGYANKLADMRTLGRVEMLFECNGVYSNYRRVIHTDTSEAEVTYKLGNDRHKRRVLASRKRDIIAISIESEKENGFSLNSGFYKSLEGGRENELKESDAQFAQYRVDSGCYIYSSKHEGKYFGIVSKVVTDGKQSADPNGITVNNATESLVLMKAFSCEDDRIEGESKALKAILECPFDYDSIFEENLPLYKELYFKADVSLYEGETYSSNEQLIEEAKDDEITPELSEKLWRFGRYLFISGTSQDGLPFPLYGLWPCGYVRDFTHHVANENVQSIYWHTEAGGLGKLNESLIDYYCNKIESFRENAKNLFGCRGIFVGTYTTPVNSTVSWYVPVILHFIGCAGWLSQHFYKYYKYSGNVKLFTEKILPFMIEAAQFYEDYYYTDENGKLALYPAVSPENTPIEYYNKHKGHAMPVTKNPTVEIAILKELLTHLVSEAKTRPELLQKSEKWSEMLSIIPEYCINDKGGIAEWMSDDLHDAQDHRHISHLYPVFPGTEIEEKDDATKLAQFKRALDLRELGSYCGWSLPHMSAVYSRFKDIEKNIHMLNAFVKVALCDNFFTLGYDYHDMGITGYECGDEYRAPVQLDAIMGFVNAIQEMLIFSLPGKLKLLPALPDKFKNGHAMLYFDTGFVDFSWDAQKRECHGTIHAVRDTELVLELPFEKSSVSVVLAPEECFAF